MTKQSTRWMLAMQEKYHTSEEGVREIMRQRQQKSIEARKLKGVPHRGGFSDKELAKSAGRKGRETRWGASSTKSKKV